MAQDRLDIPIGVDLTGLRAGLAQAKRDTQFFSNNLKAAATQGDKLNLQHSQLAHNLNAIAKMSDNGIKRIFVAGAEGIQAIDLESLRLETQQTVDAMAAAWKTQEREIANTVASVQQLNRQVTQPAAFAAIKRLTTGVESTSDAVHNASRDFQKLASDAADIKPPNIAPPKLPDLIYQAQVDMAIPDMSGPVQALDTFVESSQVLSDVHQTIADRTAETDKHLKAAASTSLPEIPRQPPPAPVQRATSAAAVSPTGIMGLVTSATIATAASKGMTAALSSAATMAATVRTAAGALSDTVSNLRGNFDLFRAAATAPVVDPSMNFARQDAVERATLEAARVETARRTRDAEVAGWKDTAKAAAAGADIKATAHERAAQSASKHEWANKSATGSLKLLKTVYAPVAGAVQSVSDQYQKLDPKLSEHAANLRNVATESRDSANAAALGAYVVTGALDESTQTAQQYGRVIKAAGLSSRLMFREFEGGQRVINGTMSVVSAITSPLRRMREGAAHNREEWRALRKMLGQSEKPAGPGIMAKAFGATAAASQSMARMVASSSQKVVSSIAGTSVVQRELAFQKQRFAEFKGEMATLAQPLVASVGRMKQGMAEFSADVTNHIVAGVQRGTQALNRLSQTAPAQRALSAISTASRGVGRAVDWAGPRVSSLISRTASGAAAFGRWTQSVNFGRAANSALSKSLLFLDQRTRFLRPAFGLVASGARRAFRAVGLGKKTATDTAVATQQLATAETNAATAAKQLAAGATQSQQALQQVTPVTQQASKAMRNSAPTGNRGGFGSFIKGAIASKLAIGALVIAAVTWGASNAIATETATVKFGTLLQDMDQGKALIAEITDFSAVTPFSNSDLRESAGLLLAAQVPADQVTARLQMLGDIAAGTSKPIGEITTVFQKMASTGKVEQDSLNQLAERGVPIYGALQEQLGVTRGEMLKMVGSGKVGFADMDAALQSLTAEGGVFAGGMAAQSQTVAGLWSTLKDNIGIGLETVMSVFVEGLKPVMAFGISFAQSVTSALQTARPVVVAFFGAVSSYVMAGFSLWKNVMGLFADLGMRAFELLGISGGVSLGGIMDGLMTLFTITQYTFEHFPLAAAIAFDTTVLAFVSMGNAIAHWFTVTVPAYLSWFGDNWSNLFLDAAAYVGTVFTNIGTNIKNAMIAIWDFIASGGTGALALAWTPLTEGFRKTIADLPEIPDRALTQLEVQMQTDIDGMKAEFGAGVGEAVNEALKTLKPPEKVELNDSTAADTSIADDTGKAGGKQRTSFVVDNLDRDSAAALKAVFANQQRDKTPEKQLSEQKKTNTLLASALNRPGFAPAIAGEIP